MKRILIIVAAVLAVTSMGATAAMATNTDPNADHKVTLCHRTGSETNPYVAVTVDIASSGYVQGGHDGHDQVGNGPGGDIIPAYDAFAKSGKDYVAFSYPGKNLDTVIGGSTGAAILANGCTVPEIVPPTCEETNTCPTEEHNPAVTVTVECVQGINELSYLIDADGATEVYFASEDGSTWLPADLPITRQAVEGGTSASLTFRFVFADESAVQVTAGSDLSECGTDVTPPGSGGTPPPPSVVPAATKAQNSGSLPYTL